MRSDNCVPAKVRDPALSSSDPMGKCRGWYGQQGFIPSVGLAGESLAFSAPPLPITGGGAFCSLPEFAGGGCFVAVGDASSDAAGFFPRGGKDVGEPDRGDDAVDWGGTYSLDPSQSGDNGCSIAWQPGEGSSGGPSDILESKERAMICNMSEGSPNAPEPARLVLLSDGLEAGRLKIPLENGVWFSVLYRGRHVRLLVALIKAWEADARKDKEERGYRSAKRLADSYYEKEERAWAPDVVAIRDYARQINRILRRNWSATGPAPRVVETMRSVGARLCFPIQIVRPGDPENGSAPQPPPGNGGGPA